MLADSHNTNPTRVNESKREMVTKKNNKIKFRLYPTERGRKKERETFLARPKSAIFAETFGFV